MYKVRIFPLSLFIVASICCVQQSFPICKARKPHVIVPKKVLKPQETIIAFDIDGVILKGRKANYHEWAKSHHDFVRAITTVKKEHGLSDIQDIIDKVLEENPDMKDEAEEFKKAIIMVSPIQGTFDIIHKLHNKKYSLVSASNMRGSTYKSLVDNRLLPAEFTKKFYFVVTNPLNKNKEGSYDRKPSPLYYEHFLTYIHRRFPGKFKNIIFVDDKRVNIEGAQQISGITAIHFQNPAQLERDLKKVGVKI